MNVHLIHGIRSEPDSPVKGLIGYLVHAGFRIAYPEYGYELALETKVVNPMIQGTMTPYIAEGDVLIGHSNGCAIAYELIQAGAPVKGAVFINGALTTDLVRPKGVEFIDVYFNAGDKITEAAMWGAEIGLVERVWGELGHSGYSGPDQCIHSYDCGNTPGMPHVSGHSAFFAPTNLQAWGPFLVSKLLAKV